MESAKEQIMEKARTRKLEKEKMLAEPMESENWKVQDIQSQIHNKQVELAEQENKLTEQILDNTKKVKYYKNLQKQIQNTEKNDRGEAGREGGFERKNYSVEC